MTEALEQAYILHQFFTSPQIIKVPGDRGTGKTYTGHWVCNNVELYTRRQKYLYLVHDHVDPEILEILSNNGWQFLKTGQPFPRGTRDSVCFYDEVWEYLSSTQTQQKDVQYDTRYQIQWARQNNNVLVFAQTNTYLASKELDRGGSSMLYKYASFYNIAMERSFHQRMMQQISDEILRYANQHRLPLQKVGFLGGFNPLHRPRHLGYLIEIGAVPYWNEAISCMWSGA